MMIRTDITRDLEWLRSSASAAITKADAAAVMGVDVRTLGRGIEQGDVPSIRVGRRLLVPRLPLLRLLGAEPVQ